MMSINIIMTSFKSLADKYGRKVCKNIRLQECNQYLDKVNEHYERN